MSTPNNMSRVGSSFVSNIWDLKHKMISEFSVRWPCLLVLSMFFLIPDTSAGDWHLRWSHELPARKPAWEFTQRMRRDVGYSPVLVGGTVVVGCEHNGAVLGLNGSARWKFYTGAPIRLAPAASDSHCFVGSDDGFLYCLDRNGQLIWKLRGGPSDRWVIGHERIMSAWPISTSPLLADGVLYFVAGYWPVDGIYVHAVDAATGKKIWTSNAAKFRPNRRITLIDGKLMIDGDNSNAVLDAKTGAVLREKRIKPPPAERPKVTGIKGHIAGWSQQDDFLAVGTAAGVYYFGPGPLRRRIVPAKPPEPEAPDRSSDALADAVLKRSNITAGYCLVAGLNNGALIDSLLRKSKLHVVAVDADAARVDRIRRSLDARGMFDDHRLSVLVGEPGTIGLPPYFASLIVSETDDVRANAARGALRPHGGVLVSGRDARSLTLDRLQGAPSGAADWRHEFGDAANSLASADRRVKTPLGLLWYGGEAADARFYFDGKVDHQSGHGLNPQPVPAQIVEGRMILQGAGLLAAVDVYTGRVLWESP